MSNILYHSSGGIGNVIQTIPVVRRLKQFHSVDVWHQPDIFPEAASVFRGQADRIYIGAEQPDSPYDHQVFSSYSQRCYHFFPRIPGVPEVHANLELPNEFESNMSVLFPLGLEGYGGTTEFAMDIDCPHDEPTEQFDVCLHAGGKRSKEWESKRWMHFTALAKELTAAGLTVASIGIRDEYIPGTVDRCGLPLLSSFGVIKGSRLHIANDCGSYHAACALGVPNIVIFCSTARWKNRHPLFHEKSRVIVKGLACQPCQLTPTWGKCPIGQECRNVPVRDVMSLAMEMLG